MDILVLGGNGFIGKALINGIRAFSKVENKILIVDLNSDTDIPDVDILRLDLSSKNSCIKPFHYINPSLIIHCAGYTSSDSTYDYMVRGPLVTANICDSLTSIGYAGRLLFISSTDSVETKNGYFSNISEKIIQNNELNKKFSNCIIKVPTVTGVSSNPDSDILNKIIEAVLTGSPITIPNKTSKLKLVAIEDVVNETIKILSSKKEVFSDIYSIVGKTYELGSLVSIITSVYNSNVISFDDSSFISINEDFNNTKLIKSCKTNVTKKFIKNIFEKREQILKKRGFEDRG